MATTTHESDFDRSFDFFAVHTEGKPGSDPWSDRTWSKPTIESSFESDIFEFTAATQEADEIEAEQTELFPNDPFAPISTTTVDLKTVQVAIHEQLSALYDDASSEPLCQIAGSIHINPSSDVNAPFRLLLRDPLGHISRIESRADVCKEISEKPSESERVLQVTLPSQSASLEKPIAGYICGHLLRPVPLLVKSRVHVSRSYNRVGFKLRANPTNSHPMARTVVVLAVPPHVQGDTVKMSRKGGVWDEMKRTISWAVDKLHPGESLEVQAQFETRGADVDQAPKFPVLVRSEYPVLFSSLELDENCNESLSNPIKLKLNQSGRILHRKI